MDINRIIAIIEENFLRNIILLINYFKSFLIVTFT